MVCRGDSKVNKLHQGIASFVPSVAWSMVGAYVTEVDEMHYLKRSSWRLDTTFLWATALRHYSSSTKQCLLGSVHDCTRNNLQLIRHFAQQSIIIYGSTFRHHLFSVYICVICLCATSLCCSAHLLRICQLESI